MTYPSNSPLLRNDTLRRLINIGSLYLVLKSMTWSDYYVGIFRQLAHATNLTRKSWVRSASLTKSTLCLFVLLFYHTTEFTMCSWALSSIFNSRKKYRRATPSYCFGDRGWVWSRDHSRRKLQYLVMCKGYPISEATWEPARNLLNAREVVRDCRN